MKAISIDSLEIYKVGGGVRDTLLGLPATDNDYVVVGSSAEELLSLGFKQVGRGFPVFLHPETREEYALARSEIKVSAGHLGFNFDTGSNISLIEDLSRRDITINAIALDKHGRLIDPFHGLADLQNRVLRHVSNAFVEDPLRVLRVARFCAKLDFTIAKETLALMQQISMSGELTTLSPERVWAEIIKALNSPYPKNFFLVLQECGALKVILPELSVVGEDKLLSQLLYDVLTALNTNNYTVAQRFATLYYFANLPIVSQEKAVNLVRVKQLINAACVNKDCKTLALQLITVYPELHWGTKPDAQHILNLVARIDPLRHKERYQELVALIILLATTCKDTEVLTTLNLLQTIVKKFATIDYRTLVKQSVSATQSVALIETARLDVIRSLLDNYSEDKNHGTTESS